MPHGAPFAQLPCHLSPAQRPARLSLSAAFSLPSQTPIPTLVRTLVPLS
jgi:hypothetical protein